jgi:hypothetical protein
MTKTSAKRDAVLATVIFRMTIEEALQYLAQKQIPMSRSNYCRIKGIIKRNRLKELYNHARNFEDFHISRVNTLTEIERLLWENYHKCTNPLQKSQILRELRDLQPYLTAVMEISKDLIEHKKVQAVNSKKKRKLLQEIEQEQEQEQN